MVCVVSGLRAVKVWDYGRSRAFTGGVVRSFRGAGGPRIRKGASWGPDRADNWTNRVAFTGGSRVLFRDICQMGSLAGAAYLLHNNAGVLRQAQWEQKSHVEHKRKGLLD